MTTDTAVNRYEATLEEFRDRLQHWLKAYDFDDATIRSQEEWTDRKETMAVEFCLHLTSEGALYHLVNYGWETDQDTEILDDFARHHGWFVEQGYSWSWHFMPLSQLDAMNEAPPRNAVSDQQPKGDFQ